MSVLFWESHWENLSPREFGICSVYSRDDVIVVGSKMWQYKIRTISFYMINDLLHQIECN